MLLLGMLLTSGCASYGWADRPGPSIVDRPVVVRTIDIDAHAGTDGADLTRQLIAELERAGVSNASWSSSGAQDVVECNVALVDDVGFGDHAFVRVSTQCKIDGELVTTRTADAQLALADSDRRLGRRRAAESAARATLSAVASDLATHMRE